MGRIPKDSWAIIERVIRRYPESKKEYESEFFEGSGGQVMGIKSKGGIPVSRTERIALKLGLPRLERLRREIDAVEEIYNALPVEYQKVISIRFWSNRHRNVPYLKMEQLVDYKEGQIKRISGNFVHDVGKKLGEI